MSRSKPFGSTISAIVAIIFAVVPLSKSIAASDLPKLNAKGPAGEHADKLMLFGQFVGDWEFDLIEIRPDGTKEWKHGDVCRTASW